MKILIFGLPGSGKTTFAKKLIEGKKIPHFNADEIRKLFEDWDFTENGRKRQANRMHFISNHCIVVTNTIYFKLIQGFIFMIKLWYF